MPPIISIVVVTVVVRSSIDSIGKTDVLQPRRVAIAVVGGMVVVVTISIAASAAAVAKDDISNSHGMIGQQGSWLPAFFSSRTFRRRRRRRRRRR